MIGVEFDYGRDAEAVQWAASSAACSCSSAAGRRSGWPAASTMTSEELVTGIGLFLDAIRDVAGHPEEAVREAADHGALTGVEAARLTSRSFMRM